MMSIQRGTDTPLAPVNGIRSPTTIHAPFAESHPHTSRSTQVVPQPQYSLSGTPMHTDSNIMIRHSQEKFGRFPHRDLQHDQQAKLHQSIRNGSNGIQRQGQIGSTVEDRQIDFRGSNNRHPSIMRPSRYYRCIPSLSSPWLSDNENEEFPNFLDRHQSSQRKVRRVQSAHTTANSYNKRRGWKTRTMTRPALHDHTRLTPQSWTHPLEQMKHVRRITPKTQNDLGSPSRLRDEETNLLETFYDRSSPEVPRHTRLQIDNIYEKVDHEEEDDDVAGYSADDTGQSDIDYNRLSDDGYVSTSRFSESDCAARQRSFQNCSANVFPGPRVRLRDNNYKKPSKCIPPSSCLENQRRRSRLPSRHSPDKSNSSIETTDEEEVYVRALPQKRETFRKPEVWRHVRYASRPEDVAHIQGKSRLVTKFRRGDLMEACGKKAKYSDPNYKSSKIEIRRKGILKKGSTFNDKNDNHTTSSYFSRVKRD